jgi:hypothetical protein
MSDIPIITVLCILCILNIFLFIWIVVFIIANYKILMESWDFVDGYEEGVGLKVSSETEDSV